MRFILIISAIILNFATFSSYSFADDEVVDELIKKVRRGSYEEKLNAAKELEKLGVDAKETKTKLRKQINKEKSPELVLQIISALIAMGEDDDKVYRAFRNKFKFKEKDLEAKLVAEEYLHKMPKLSNISEQLIDHVKGYRDDNKFDPILVYQTLTRLLEREPQYIEKIVSEIQNDPENSIRTLVYLDDGVAQYWPQVFAKLDDEPIAVMDFARKHGDINDPQLVQFAIASSKDIPKTTSFGVPLFFSGTYFHAKKWMDSIDALIDMSANNEMARQAVLDVLDTPWWYIAVDLAIEKTSIDPALLASLKSTLMEKLQQTVSTDAEITNVEEGSKVYNRLYNMTGNDGYRICRGLASLGNLEPTELEAIKNILLSSPSEMTVTGCLLPFRYLTEDTVYITPDLERLLDMDWEKELKEGEYYAGRARLSNGFNYSILRTRPSFTTSMVPYNAAAALLNLNPTHAKAISVVKKYQENLPIIERIHYRFLKKSTYISYYYDDQDFYAFQAEFSPLELLSNGSKSNPEAWNKLMLDALNAEQEAQNLNAAQLIERNDISITDEVKSALIRNASKKTTDPKSYSYLNALKKHFPDDPEIQNLRATRYNHHKEELHFEIFNM